MSGIGGKRTQIAQACNKSRYHNVISRGAVCESRMNASRGISRKKRVRGGDTGRGKEGQGGDIKAREGAKRNREGLRSCYISEGVPACNNVYTRIVHAYACMYVVCVW